MGWWTKVAQHWAVSAVLVVAPAALFGCSSSSTPTPVSDSGPPDSGDSGPPLTTCATPTFKPAGGTFTSATKVTIATKTAGATIFYTTDGTNPTSSSTVFDTSLEVSTSETVRAACTAPGFSLSKVAAETFTIKTTTTTCAKPTAKPPGGAYTSPQSVALATTTADATIYFTTDGTNPTTASTVYADPIAVSASETIRSLCTSATAAASPVDVEAYTCRGLYHHDPCGHGRCAGSVSSRGYQ